MSEDRYYGVLAHASARKLAADACMTFPLDYIVRIEPPTRNKAQNAKMHAMIRDIAQQWMFQGRYWHADDMKRMLVDAFAKAKREMGEPLHHDGRVVPSLDGERVVQLGIQTADFTVKENSDFIEFLFAWGAELHHQIIWRDAA